MIITTLALSFLLSFLPLVIGTLCLRYRPNLFSRGIFTLSALGCLLGLAQFGLLLSTSYKLLEPAQMKQAYLWIQYVSIAGGLVMIAAGFLWVGYFRILMRGDVPARVPSPSRRTDALSNGEETPAAAVKARQAIRKRREKPAAPDDWFADEIPLTRSVRMAAKVSRKKTAPSGDPAP